MLLDFSFSNTALYQASVIIVFRQSSCCSKEKYLNLTKKQNQLLYMFDVVKKRNAFVGLLSNITISYRGPSIVQKIFSAYIYF